MKKVLLTVLFFIAVNFCAFSGSKFINTRISPVYSSSSFSSSRVGMLKYGDEVTVLEEIGEWTKIEKGFIQAKFLSNEKGITKSSKEDSKISSIEVRKRSSSFSTSAAATRGNNSENVRDRENVSFNNYDFESLKWIEENFSYRETDLILFFEGNFN